MDPSVKALWIGGRGSKEASSALSPLKEQMKNVSAISSSPVVQRMRHKKKKAQQHCCGRLAFWVGDLKRSFPETEQGVALRDGN
jgi:hypothetical protein